MQTANAKNSMKAMFKCENICTNERLVWLVWLVERVLNAVVFVLTLFAPENASQKVMLLTL
jgi:hypothetical protein